MLFVDRDCLGSSTGTQDYPGSRRNSRGQDYSMDSLGSRDSKEEVVDDSDDMNIDSLDHTTKMWTILSLNW